MSYLEGSSLQEASEGLSVPTMEEFMARVGDPALSFSINSGELNIPKGLLNCCRVAHQPHCKSYVAGTLVGCLYTIKLPDGTVRERVPEKQSFAGDALYEYARLAGSVQVVWLLVQQTAKALDAEVLDLTFDVWTLDLEAWEMWRYLEAERQKDMEASLAEMDPTDGDYIKNLDIHLLTPEEQVPSALAERLVSEDFFSAAMYADRVELMPGEVGHDAEFRYVTSLVWGEADVVPPAVDALQEVPEEPCPQATPSTSS